MENKLISLIQLTNLKDDPELSESFVRFIAGFSKFQKYRHQEIIDVFKLLENIDIDIEDSEDYIYGYCIPHLNKEFDLIKICERFVLNIELKSHFTNEQTLLKQLIQNRHFLKMLGKTLYCFTYISDRKSLYKLSDDELVSSSFDELNQTINEPASKLVDLDDVFSPNKIIISPLNDSLRFLKHEYLLTENQENIKKSILETIEKLERTYFVGLTGAPGTGKTLLMYDIAKEMCIEKRLLIVHSGQLCEGHFIIQSNISNLRILEAKYLRLREIQDVDIVFVDEAQRLYKTALEKIERWANKSKTVCLLSYDPSQIMSHSENRRQTVERINEICGTNKYQLTSTIRTNKEISLFISCLMDLSKYRSDYNFPNVKIFYEPKKENAVEKAKYLKKFGYEFISYTPSLFSFDLDYQNCGINTHKVIGQEFDRVCMLLDDNFYYEKNLLKGLVHPNPDYIFTGLLYQGLTRARSKIALVITDKELLSNIMKLFRK